MPLARGAGRRRSHAARPGRGRRRPRTRPVHRPAGGHRDGGRARRRVWTSRCTGCPAMTRLAPLCRSAPGDLLVVTDARRREVYLSAYRPGRQRLFGPAGRSRRPRCRSLLAEHGVDPAHLAGAGPAGCSTAFRRFEPAPVGAQPADPLSGGLVERAAVALLTGAVPGPLTPLYLRRPDATEPGARQVGAGQVISPTAAPGDGTSPGDAGLERLAAADIPALVKLEELLFPGDSPWTGRDVRRGTGGGQSLRGAPRPDGSDRRLRGAGDHRRRGRGAGRSACARTPRGAGSGGSCCDSCCLVAGQPAGAAGGAHRQRAAIALYTSEGFTIRLGIRRRYYQPSGADAYTMARPR